MTKKLLFTFLFIGIFLIGSAQTFEPGLTFGLTTSQVNGDGLGGFNKMGITFGGSVKYQINDLWSTQFELNYVQKGSRNDFSITSNNPGANAANQFLMRLNYIEIPLLIRFHHNKFIFESGLSYGRLAGVYVDGAADNGSVIGPINDLDEFNEEVTNPLRDWEFGFHMGFGFKATDVLLFNVRYSTSILPIKDYDSGARDTFFFNMNLGWAHHVLAFTLRYKFGEPEVN